MDDDWLEEGMELRKNITGVQHLGIPVLCMEETKKFYVENFGFEVFHEKQIFYTEKMNKYGVPLDSRAEYTKIDWLMWSTCICDDKEYFDSVCEAIINMINETPDRAPMTDWYFTTNAMMRAFRNRTVVGGLFINMI